MFAADPMGEHHGINWRPSVEEGRDAAMLNWFDKYLRDRPEAWAARWEKRVRGDQCTWRPSANGLAILPSTGCDT
ncbi:MAG: hypothetical protein ABIZ91_12950 [Gemmatimonadaceae bacterium]